MAKRNVSFLSLPFLLLLLSLGFISEVKQNKKEKKKTIITELEN